MPHIQIFEFTAALFFVISWIKRINLDYSQAEMTVAARHEPWSCTHVPQMGRNEADMARFGLPEGEKVAMIRMYLEHS